MPKKVAYTNITPIPSFIPRQLALDMLKSHSEVIELNPLVTEHHQIKAPRDAPADEFFSVWYEITERIQYIPGAGKLGSGKISFKGVFHDMPWGLQTHIYAPAGVDLRNKWQIKGNQPGEPPEPRELGSAAPPDGLYLREDVEIKCNFTMVPFVKSTTKAASKVLVERLVKKAELIDAELLKQMMQGQQQQADNNQLNPMGHSPQPGQQPPGSPGMMSPSSQYSPNTDTFRRQTMLSNSEVLRKREEALRQSLYSSGSFRSQHSPALNHPPMMEMMGSLPQQGGPQAPQNGLAIEMPGDMYYSPQHQQQQHQLSQSQSQSSPNLHPSQYGRASVYSELSGDGSKPSSATHDNSYVQDNATVSSGWGGSQTSHSHSPNPEAFRYSQSQQSQQSSQGPQVPQGGGYQYNPQHFAQEMSSK
jgi:hypothetical protein